MHSAWEVEGRTVAWPDHAESHYQIPFVYSCNGSPFIKQLAEQTGTWFRDVREPANLAKPLLQALSWFLQNLRRFSYRLMSSPRPYLYAVL